MSQLRLFLLPWNWPADALQACRKAQATARSKRAAAVDARQLELFGGQP